MCQVHAFAGPGPSRVLQGLIRLGSNMKSLKHIDLNRVASSLFKIELFLPSPTCLVVSLVVYSLSWCSQCIEVH